jgi:hypothetical protein
MLATLQTCKEILFNDQSFYERKTNMSATLRTFVKTRTTETKVLHILAFLGILGGAWLIHHLAQLATFEIHSLIP